MKKALALLRVSTDKQDLDRQKTDIDRVLLTHGLQIEGDPVALEDVSGRAVKDNADMQRMLADLKRPDIAGVAVSALDRLFRADHYSDFGILDKFRDTGKLIFSAKEGVIDARTDIGFLVSLMSGAQAGMEWRTLRQRTLDGKREKRKLGRNVNGSASLPSGICYERITDAAGRTIDGRWYYDEALVAKIREAFKILFADHTISLTALAKRVGWPSSRGYNFRRLLENPIWKGVRIYPPMQGETEPVEVKLALDPVLTPDQWALARKLLSKRSTWSKETRVQRFLGAGVLFCECGRRYYFHGDKRRKDSDYYSCASRHPRGEGCGAVRLKREVVDAAILRIVDHYMTDPKFLAGVFARLKQTPQPDLGKRERELAKLAARRQKWIEQYDEDRITKREFDDRMDAVAKATREIEATMPTVPPPVPDHRAVVAGLVRVLARLRSRPFADQRALLKRVIRSVHVVDAAIPDITLSGSFLGEFACTNSAQRSGRSDSGSLLGAPTGRDRVNTRSGPHT